MSENEGSAPIAGSGPEGASPEPSLTPSEAEPAESAKASPADVNGSPSPDGAAPKKKRRRRRRRKSKPAAGADLDAGGTSTAASAEGVGGTSAPNDAGSVAEPSPASPTTESDEALASEAPATGGAPAAGETPAAGEAPTTSEAPATGEASTPAQSEPQETSPPATPPPPPKPTEKDQARYRTTREWLSEHADELGVPVEQRLQAVAEPPSDLDTIWQIDTALYQALTGDGAHQLPAPRRRALHEEALEQIPTLTTLTACLQLAWSERAAPSADTPDTRAAIATEPPRAVESSETASDTNASDTNASDTNANDAATSDVIPGVARSDDATTTSDAPPAAANSANTSPDDGAQASTPDTPPQQAATPRTTGRASVSSSEETGERAELPLIAGKSPFDLVRRVESRVGDTQSLNRLLSLLEQHVDRGQWIEWLLAMQENRDLKRTLESGEVPQSWRALVPHARALAAVVVRGQTNQWGARQLHHGLRTLLRSGADSLMTRPVAMRERLVRLALRLRLKPQDLAAVSRLLDSLEGDSAALSLALEHVRGLLSSHQYEKAAQMLLALQPRSRGEPLVGHWLKALSGPRYGSVALLKSRARPPLMTDFPLRPALWLAQQNDVWLRVGVAESAAHFAQHVETHRRAEIPGVSIVVEHGFTKGNRPYAAYERKGENAKFALTPAHGASREEALDSARQLLQLAYGLARAGVVLPDAELGRLERDASGRLWLVESWGAKLAALDVAQESMIGILRSWLAAVLFDSPNFALKPDIMDTLRHAADFATVRATLDVLSRTRLWEP